MPKQVRINNQLKRTTYQNCHDTIFKFKKIRNVLLVSLICYKAGFFSVLDFAMTLYGCCFVFWTNLRSGVPIFFHGGKECLIQLHYYSSAAP